MSWALITICTAAFGIRAKSSAMRYGFTTNLHRASETSKRSAGAGDVDITDESVRQWCLRSGSQYGKRIRARAGRSGDTRHLGEVFIQINRKVCACRNFSDLGRSVLALQINASSPFLSSRLSSLRDGPLGCLAPISHCRTVEGLVLRREANTVWLSL